MTAGYYNNEHDADKQVESDNHISTLCTQEKLELSSWGLPEKVLQFYSGKGITHMFSWQLECLSTGKVLEGGNLVYSAPTSAGKTLVAEILIAQTIFERQKKVILILPFVSVVREKMFYFQSLFSQSGIKVEGFMGGHTPSAGFKQIHMGVCTIEKANSVINRLLEEKNLQCLGLVVVDELHLLGDPYRGYLLELLLTKLKYMSYKLETKIQIVGMSATLPNLKVLADWLNADLYYSSYRPIPLSETLKCGNCIYDKKLIKLREIVSNQSEVPDGPDHLGQLCLETLQNGHSVLIFCPSKNWCENLADEIALFFKRLGCSKSAVVENTPGWIVRNQINFEKISRVIEHLKMTPVGIDNDLLKTISYGVAFHHAGLTLDERDIIEGSFRNGAIRVLCATSTLSSGVNLPARRVIIRSPMAFGSVMDVLTYRQMIGRAGRMGVDSEGESILICKTNEKIICQQLMSSNLKPIESCLGRGLLSSSLKRALLEIVVSGIASTPDEVQDYANCTFLASSSKNNLQNPITSCISFLEENEFIRLQENGTIYTATPLGEACLASSMPPDEGLSLFRELQRARRSFVLDTDLHIIYQVTPYSISEQWTKLDWLHVLSVIENLPENMKRVGEMVGVEESFLVRIAKGTLNPNVLENRIKLSIHRRFYTALALQDLVNEVPLSEVSQKFDCNKGTLQSLQQSAATYAGMVTEFTRKLGWGIIELIFSQFQERLQFGVQRDLCELMRLPMLNVTRARTLYNAGYTNILALANARASDLERILYSTIPFQTTKDIDGETTFERIQRNKLQTIWITGKADISVREAAEALIEQSRNTLETEMGVAGVQWGGCSNGSLTSSPKTGKLYGSNLMESPAVCMEKDVSCSENSRKEDLNQKRKYGELVGHDTFPETPVNIKAEKFISTRHPKNVINFLLDDDDDEADETLKSHNHEISVLENVPNFSRNESDYFATSFNVMNFSEIVDKNQWTNQEGKVDESECSSESVEVLCEKPIMSNKIKSERISGDIFDFQEVEIEEETVVNESKSPGEDTADLFSQSLTFDTQMQEILEMDGPKSKKKLSNSINSDDLGFVSDFSPPRLNAIGKMETIKIKENLKSFLTPNEKKTEENFTSKSRGETLKRKNCVSNSPDFIIGSDDSWIEDGHVSKKVKMRFSKSNNSESNSPRGLMESSLREDSDSEILPTPKTNRKVSSLKSMSVINMKGIILEKQSNNVVSNKLSYNREVENGGGISEEISVRVKPFVSSAIVKKQTEITKATKNNSERIHWDKIDIIDVFANKNVNESFREELKQGTIVGLALGCRKVSRERKSSIGLKIMKRKMEKPKQSQLAFQHKDIILDGISLYFRGNTVFYISLDGESVSMEQKVSVLREISSKKGVFRLFDAKEQVKLFHYFVSIFISGSFEDPKTAHWLLSRSWKEKSYTSIVIEYLPEATKLVSQIGPLLGFSGPGVFAKSSVQARTRASLEAFLSFHAIERQSKLLQGKSLLKLFQDVEMPLVSCLAEMELIGFRFDRDKLMNIKSRIEAEQSKLSEKACSFAKYKFSLASPAAVSRVLYNDLKLGTGNGPLTKRRRLSTNKDALQDLSIETNHPLPDIIIDWRKIESVLTKVLAPLLQLDPDSSRLFPSTHLYTSTGRLSMQEPNLQNIPRNFNVNFGNNDSDISVREMFIPSDGCVLLSVDYCQIELRLLAHLSGDHQLIESINNSSDIFVSVASHIYGVSTSTVDDDLRQKAKKTCYGIIYGISPRALSHQLRVEESAALNFMEDFKSKYKGVTKYLENTVNDCRKKGYIASLMGRRRYLPYINDTNPAVKSEAERQAINTTIQGSAADLLKIVIVKIKEKIKDLNDGNFTFNLLLHLHDELLYEVKEEFTETAAVILKDVMENILVLRVPTPVKFHVGPSWGQLRPYEI